MTRADLTPGQQTAQVAHAVIDNAYQYADQMKKWHSSSNYIVVVEAPDAKALERIQFKALHQGIISTPFREPDLDNELTAIAFPPSTKVRKLLSNLPLAGKKHTTHAKNCPTYPSPIENDQIQLHTKETAR